MLLEVRPTARSRLHGGADADLEGDGSEDQEGWVTLVACKRCTWRCSVWLDFNPVKFRGWFPSRAGNWSRKKRNRHESVSEV